MDEAHAVTPGAQARACARKLLRAVWWTSLLIAALTERSARAQEGDWLIVPSAVAHEGEGVSTARRAGQHLERALGQHDGVHLLAPERARARFEQRGSTAPLMVSHSDLDALARDTQMALYHVASGLPSQARQDVERALTRADKVLESLNRESLAAQQLLDACLYLVRAHLQSNDRPHAREQALECKRLVPDIEPDGTMHPPEVIGILAEAEAELRQREPGSLRVESAPEGCAVYINGRHLGDSPYELPQLSPGEYRVQAECEEGRAGRVHRVTVGTTRVIKRIDTRFDAAVQTSLDIALRYDSAEGQRLHAYADALEIGRTVGVANVLLLLPVSDAQGKPTSLVQIDRVRMRDAKLMAVARLNVDGAGAVDAAALAGATRDVMAGERRDHSVSPPGAIEDVYAVAAAPRPEGKAWNGDSDTGATPLAEAAAAAATSRAGAAEDAAATGEGGAAKDAQRGWSPAPAGLVVGATGAVATLVAWGLYVRQYSLELGYTEQRQSGGVEGYHGTLGALHHIEYVPLIVGGAGALLLAASLPWVLPDPPPDRSVPLWSIIVGSAGGVAAIAGAFFTIRGANCKQFDSEEGRCLDRAATTHLGPLLIATAVPLLATPFVYLLNLRPQGQARDTSSVAFAPARDGRGFSLFWRGTL